jgi:hypothetical protein
MKSIQYKYIEIRISNIIQGEIYKPLQIMFKSKLSLIA